MMSMGPAARPSAIARSDSDLAIDTDVDVNEDVDTGTGDGSDAGSAPGYGYGYGSEAFLSEKAKEPDLEENENENAPTSPTSPLAPYPPLAPTDTRSRAPEFYGFVAWTSTYLLFVLYLLWAFLPDERILALGVSWYPNREWSLLIPAYGMVLVLLTYFTYFALAFAGTPSFADMRTITDSKAHLPHPPAADDDDENTSADSESASNLNRNRTPPPGHKREPTVSHRRETPLKHRRRRDRNYNPYLEQAKVDAIPELYDIPLGLVNRVVYGPPRRRRSTTGSDPAGNTTQSS
ncbi:PIG-P-domain-containing protein [Lentinus tigrinus ALCF2SS1-7]|uniref:PIG-P-domain-containing protein n=1 Tax=Lentinus tigrinus ALCF2SS1-7 TaxID=1328758 RepID=UPI0011660B85|nr:PIG-P-domain-containing protein [Lentinus tigrinus ALCF2SS1-7]